MKLEVEIVKQLPRFAVDISLACGSGELLALVGPSGSGKTTLMRTIAGLDRPDIGRINFNGEAWLDTRDKIDLPPQNRNLGYVFQEYTLFPHLTVFKNVAFAGRDKKKVADLLKLFDVWHLRERKPNRLSGGERQRVALAQALAKEPKVLLLDEPFSALDIVTRRNLRQGLLILKKEFNLPIIHITHDLEEAEYLADTLLPVVKGRIETGWLAERPGQNHRGSELDRPRGEIIKLSSHLNFRSAAGK